MIRDDLIFVASPVIPALVNRRPVALRYSIGMADHSYDTPTRERSELHSCGEADFPDIQGGRYRFLKVVGSGGAGTVYKAHDTVLDKDVAIKKLHNSASETMAIRFQREARLVAALKHDNVMSALDFGLTRNNEPYLILDYVDGDSLSRVIRRAGPLPPRQALDIFIQLSRGLAHAHQNNVIHRDVKPSNVMLVKQFDGATGEEFYVARVVDFGLAKDVNEDLELTKSNTGLGTPMYMPPEQLRGLDSDKCSDIYSFGCLMFEVLSGAPPFAAETTVELADMHMNAEPPTLASRGVHCSSDMERIVAKCLEKNSKDRHQSFEGLLALLEHEAETIADEPELPEVFEDVDDPIPIPISTAPKSDTSSLFLVGIVVVALIIIAVPTVVLWSQQNTVGKQSIVDSTTMFPVRRTDDRIVYLGKVNMRSEDMNEVTGNPSAARKERKEELGNWVSNDAEDSDIERFLRENPKVVRFDLNDSLITSRSFDALAKLKTLRSITYCSKPLNEEVINNLVKLDSITSLEIGPTDEVDVNALKKLRKLPSLKYLRIHKMNLNEPILAEIGALQTLTELNLSGCTGMSVEGLRHIARLGKLNTLKLSRTDITDAGVKEVSGVKLKTLELESVPGITQKILPLLGGMKSLVKLNLKGNQAISAEEITAFRAKYKRISCFVGESSRQTLDEP